MKPADFPPSRRRGRTIHVILLLVLTALVVVCSILASRQPLGPFLTVFIILAVLAFIPIPILAYRLLALNRANYRLDREALTLTWGLRTEEIPVSEIEWVRPKTAVTEPFPLPFFRMPGSILGIRRHPDLGPVEYLASETKNLLLVATSHKIFAISPEDQQNFLQEVQRAIEMGSLAPATARSIYPSFVVAQAWDSRMARFLWLAGLFANIG